MSSETNWKTIAALGDDFEKRIKRGENPTIEEYALRHPQLASEIRDFLHAIKIVKDLRKDSAGYDEVREDRTPPLDSSVPKISDYRIVREIARGGMGIVYEARQISLDRPVALKTLPDRLLMNKTAVTRFQREARSAAALHHTNIIPVFDVGIQSEVCFYTMQLIQGATLDTVIGEIENIKHAVDTSDELSQSIALSLLRPSEQQLSVHDDSLRTTSDLEGAAETTSGNPLPASSTPSEPNRPRPKASAATTKISDADEDTHASIVEGYTSYANDGGSISNSKTFFNGVAKVGYQVADALRYAHSRGIIHRDIKPSNLLLDLAGNAWVADFGLAKTEDDGLTKTGDIVGTLRYMAPERLEGKCDARSDVYSLGITLYELASQRKAFQSSDKLSLLEQIRSESPPDLRSLDPSIPRDLQTIVKKTIEKQPERRYPNAQALADDLARFMDGRPIQARSFTLLERAWFWSRRNPAIAALLLLLFVGTVFTITGSVFAALEFREMALVQQALAQDASSAEKRAIESAESLRQSLYLADMPLIQDALSNGGGVTGARNKLREWIPQNESEPDLRTWEWYWLSAMANREVFVFKEQHRPGLMTLDFSPDCKLLAMATSKEIQLYSTETWQITDVIARVANAIVFSSDGKRIASTQTQSGRVSITDLASFECVTSDQFDGTIGCLAWSPEDHFLAFTVRPRKANERATLRVWDLLAGKTLHLPSIEGDWDGIEFSPDGKRLALTVSGDCRWVQLIDTQEWKIIQKQDLFAPQSMNLAWNPEGDRVAMAGAQGGVKIWNLENNTVDSLRHPDNHFVTQVDWDPTGDFLVATSRQQSVTIWSPREKQIVDELIGCESRVSNVKWSANGRFLAAGTLQAVRVWDLNVPSAHYSIPVPHFGGRAKLSWQPDDSLLVSGNDFSTILPANQFQGTFAPRAAPTSKEVCQWTFDPSGRWQAGLKNKTIQVWPAEDEELKNPIFEFTEVRQIAAHSLDVLSWHPTEPRLLINAFWDDPYSHAQGYRIRIFDASSATVQSVLTERPKAQNVRWDPSGQFLSYTAGDFIGVYEVATNDFVFELQTPPGEETCVCWNPDGAYLAIANSNGVISILDSKNGSELLQLVGHTSPVLSIAWSADGQRIATACRDKSVRLWDFPSGRSTLAFPHPGAVLGVAWSPDSKRLVTAAEDQCIRVWDANAGYYRK